MGYFAAVSILASLLASGGCVSPEPDRDPAPASDLARFSLSSAMFDRLITHDSVDLSVEGTVASISSRWGTSAHGDELIYTDVDFDVELVLRGNAAAGTLRFVYEGGTVGDTTLHVSHTPTMDTGERAIVLLASVDDGLQLLGHDYARIPLDRPLVLDGEPITPGRLRSRIADLTRSGGADR